MMINQYSFVGFGLALLIIAGFFSWRLIGLKIAIPIVLISALILVISQSMLSTKQNPYTNLEVLNESVNSGKPSLLVFYSDF